MYSPVLNRRSINTDGTNESKLSDKTTLGTAKNDSRKRQPWEQQTMTLGQDNSGTANKETNHTPQKT